MRDSARWNAVFGAALARQVWDFMAKGRGAPDPADYDRFTLEAATVADEAEEAVARLQAQEEWPSD